MASKVSKNLKHNEKDNIYSFVILIYGIFSDQCPYPLFENRSTQENYWPEFMVSVKSSIKK